MIKSLLKQRLKQLETQLSSTKKQGERDPLKKEIYYLKIKIARETAYNQLIEGNRVSFQGKTGTITGKYLTNGGLPSLWVQWDADPEREDGKGVILPEDPMLMTLIN